METYMTALNLTGALLFEWVKSVYTLNFQHNAMHSASKVSFNLYVN